MRLNGIEGVPSVDVMLESDRHRDISDALRILLENHVQLVSMHVLQFLYADLTGQQKRENKFVLVEQTVRNVLEHQESQVFYYCCDSVLVRLR